MKMLKLGWVIGAIALGACSGDGNDGSGSGGSAGADGGQAGGSAGASGMGGSSGSATGGASGASGGIGGSGAAPADAGTDAPQTPWDEYCTAAKQQYAACGEPWHGCAPSTCVATVWNAAVLSDYTSCMLARSCTELGSDDACFSASGLEDGGIPQSVKDAIDACVAKVITCNGQGSSINADNCTFAAPLVNPTLSAQAMACFDKPCADIDACLQPIRAQFDCLDAQ